MGAKENAAYFVAGVLVTGLVVEGARRVEDAGAHRLIKLAPQVPIRIHRATLYEVQEGEARDIEALRGVTIIVGGDSQGLAGDKRVVGPHGEYISQQPGSLDEHIAAELNRQYPQINATHENHSVPGLWSSGLLEQLRKREDGGEESELRKALLSPGRKFLALSIGPNDWQNVVSDPELLQAVMSLGEGGLSVAKIATVVKTVLALTKGHHHVTEKLGGIIPQILHEVQLINEERQALGLEPLVGAGLLCPPDFGKAHAISVGQPGVEKTQKVHMTGALRRFGSIVAEAVADQTERGMQEELLGVPLVFFSSERAVFPQPTGQEQSEDELPDQHLGPYQRQVGSDAANTLLAVFAPVDAPLEDSEVAV